MFYYIFMWTVSVSSVSRTVPRHELYIRYARRGFERLRAAGVTGQISVTAANVFKRLPGVCKTH